MSSEPPVEHWRTDGQTDRPRASGLTRRQPTAERFQRVQEFLGRKWHPVIVYELLQDGPQGFSDLRSAIDGVSGKMLSESLEDLEAADFIDRTIVSERPFRVEYSLTPRGQALEPVLTAMLDWQATHDDAR